MAKVELEDIVARQTQESKTVGDLSKNVKEDVRQTTEFFRNQMGGDGASLMSSHLETQANTYTTNLTSSLDTNFDIDAQAPDGVAGYNRKGGDNGIAIADDMLSTEQVMENPDYLERLKIHEETHQNLQAAEYDRDTLQLPDAEVSVVGDMTERQAIREAEQPDSELVPEYVAHAENGDAVVEYLGADAHEKVEEAMKTGEMQVLQEEIDEKAEEEGDILPYPEREEEDRVDDDEKAAGEAPKKAA